MNRFVKFSKREFIMKKLTLILVAISLFMAFSVMAEEQVESETTFYLLGTCMDVVHQDETLTTSVYCKAFIQGAINTHKYYTSSYNFPRQYCLPGEISERNIIGIFVKFVGAHPNFIEKPAITTLHHALKYTYPCNEPESPK